MRKIGKLVTSALVVSLALTPSAAAGDTPEPDTAAQTDLLEVDRGFEHVGSLAEVAEIQQQRLATGPTGPALYTLAEDGRYVVETNASDVVLDEGLDVGIDPVSFNECEQRHTSPNPPYWFKNKYNSCRGADLEVKYIALVNGRPEHVGSTFFRRSFIGVAQDRSNQIVFGVRLNYVRDERTTFKNTTLSMRIGCLNRDQSRDSTCTVSPPVSETKTVQQWQDEAGSAPAWFTANATTTSVPADDKYAAELRGYFAFDLVTTTTSPTGLPWSDFSPTEYFRCDEATYVSGSKCVFIHVASSLSFNANDPEYGESATFIRDAQTNITSTKPGLLGKKVPGRFGEEPLHRLYHAYDTEKDIDGSRRKVRRTCRHYFGVTYTRAPDGTRRQCDEYPFATTYENAARVDESKPLTFAVKAISATHNETAGRIYGTWLGADHILDYDPFYIIIR